MLEENNVQECSGLLCGLDVGCGTSYSGNGGGGGGNYAGQAQGVYSGTTSSGYSFSTIVLPTDKFYAIYGTVSGNTLLLNGLVTGQGTSGNGTYTASVTDYITPIQVPQAVAPSMQIMSRLLV